jgi:hypothetical protein
MDHKNGNTGVIWNERHVGYNIFSYAYDQIMLPLLVQVGWLVHLW